MLWLSSWGCCVQASEPESFESGDDRLVKQHEGGSMVGQETYRSAAGASETTSAAMSACHEIEVKLEDASKSEEDAKGEELKPKAAAQSSTKDSAEKEPDEKKLIDEACAGIDAPKAEGPRTGSKSSSRRASTKETTSGRSSSKQSADSGGSKKTSGSRRKSTKDKASSVKLGELLVTAAEKGDADKVYEMLRDGVPIDAQDGEGRSAVRTAAKFGHVELVRRLVTEFGANVNDRNPHNGYTCLHWACKFNRKDTVELLVKLGADGNQLDKDGHLPVDLLKKKNPELAAWLACALEPELEKRSRRKSIDRRSSQISTASSGVMSGDGTELLDSMQKGRDLVTAAENQDIEELRRLIQDGAAIDTVDDQGRSALRESAKFGRVDMIRALITEFHADVNSRNPYSQYTALHWACKFDREETIKLLMSLGAKRTLRSADGFEPADLLQKRNPSLAEWLKSAPEVISEAAKGA
eukprot:TRINITY_DN49589_c0_g1_i1.p1 TRINITY_DN49589_c0_g1~~TRINITY_DN49589_c0_g1_i1.p1  ORF type:complete len:469 (+),score=105.22 TRINITY_DN49589_c0_g1_i1:27-1433(+)